MKFQNVVAVALLIMSMTLQVKAHDTDSKGGCVPIAEFQQQHKELNTSVVAVLGGNSVFLNVRDESYRFSVGMYKVGSKQRTVVTVRNMPSERNPSKVCVMFFSEESHGVLANLAPGTAAAKPTIIGGDLQTIRNACADKVMPAMISLYNKQVINVGGTWMTWNEKMYALAQLIGKDTDAQQRKYDKEDSDRIAKARTDGDYYCDRFSEIIERQNKRNSKLAMMVDGTHFTVNGHLSVAGSLALFVPAIKRKPDDVEWWLYMVTGDGKAYLAADGDQIQY